MSQWLRAAERFEENSHNGNYFEAQSAVYALRRVQTLLETTFPQMFFLLGEPGSGKSFMLHHLQRLYQGKRLAILIENPFLTPAQFLKRLLNCVGIKTKTSDVEALRLEAIEAFTGVEHLIMLDEAQLMSVQMREFVRILSDSKVFYFLIAMHKVEGEEMLSSAHFHSRPHQVVYLGDLEPDECLPYLIKELQPLEIWDVRELFSKNLVNQACRYSNGNFRNFKKCFYHLFLFLDYAQTHNKREFLKPNLLLLRMAAMKGRVLANQLNTDDFEALKKEAKGSNLSKNIIITTLFGVLISGAVAAWLFFSASDEIEVAKVDVGKNAPKPEEQLPEAAKIAPEPVLESELLKEPEPAIEPQASEVKEEPTKTLEPQAPELQEQVFEQLAQNEPTQTFNVLDKTLPLFNPQLPPAKIEPPLIQVQPYSEQNAQPQASQSSL